MLCAALFTGLSVNQVEAPTVIVNYRYRWPTTLPKFTILGLKRSHRYFSGYVGATAQLMGMEGSRLARSG